MYPNTNNFYQYGPQYQQRLSQMEQNQQAQYGMQSMAFPSMNSGYIKGRPVVSIEEARASQIDLDGSLFVFTDVGNKKIYTKQINLDGTATLNTYSLVDDNISDSDSYVTKSEFEEVINSIREQLERDKEKQNDKPKQSGAVKTTVSKPAF